MSKEEQELGTGPSSGRTSGGRDQRDIAKARAQGDTPSYALTRLPLEEVASTPLNPRRHFGSDEELTRFGEDLRTAQLHACVAVSRSAYLNLWPDHAEHLEESARYVLINGERRVRSARHVSLTHLDFVIRDDLAATRETFINYVLQENLSRKDFNVIERAHGVRSLVDACAEEAGERGAQVRAATQLGKHPSWVTNQLSLLFLPEELRTRLIEGSLPERDGRVMARHAKEHPEVDADALLVHLEMSKQADKDKKAKAAAALAAVAESLEKTANEAPAIPSPSAPLDVVTASENLGTASSAPNVLQSADDEAQSTPAKGPTHIDRDSVEQLDVFRRRSIRFANEMTGLEETYRLAFKENPELAESHLTQILERLDRVGRHLKPRQQASQEASPSPSTNSSPQLAGTPTS